MGGALRIVFIDPWVSENGHAAVAELRDQPPAPVLGRRCANAMVVLQNRGPLFRVKQGRQSGGADQIGEQDADLTTFRFQPRFPRLTRDIFQLVNRHRKASALTDVEAKFLQIVLCQIRNEVHSDIVFLENR